MYFCNVFPTKQRHYGVFSTGCLFCPPFAMQTDQPKLPEVGDIAPSFEVETSKGLVRFPEYADGCWCVFFAHPANFTSCWAMFSAFLGKKERWLNERNTKVLALCNETLPSNNDWSEKARRFIGIYLNAPVIEDLDFKIARMFGLASGRRPQPGLNRLAVIIDPEGVVRMVIHRPLLNIMDALDEIAIQLDRLQGNTPDPALVQFVPEIPEIPESTDAIEGSFETRPAHFPRKLFGVN